MLPVIYQKISAISQWLTSEEMKHREAIQEKLSAFTEIVHQALDSLEVIKSQECLTKIECLASKLAHLHGAEMRDVNEILGRWHRVYSNGRFRLQTVNFSFYLPVVIIDNAQGSIFLHIKHVINNTSKTEIGEFSAEQAKLLADNFAPCTREEIDRAEHFKSLTRQNMWEWMDTLECMGISRESAVIAMSRLCTEEDLSQLLAVATRPGMEYIICIVVIPLLSKILEEEQLEEGAIDTLISFVKESENSSLARWLIFKYGATRKASSGERYHMLEELGPFLKTLDLAEVWSDTTTWNAGVALRIIAQVCKRLEELSHSREQPFSLDREGDEALSSIIFNNKASLTAVDLSNLSFASRPTSIYALGCCAGVSILDLSKIITPSSSYLSLSGLHYSLFTKNPNLRVLNLNGIQLPIHYDMPLYEALAPCSSLEILGLASLQGQHRHASWICNVVRNNPNLREINLSGCEFTPSEIFQIQSASDNSEFTLYI